ncbi:MAG: DUF4249 family protein [Candidatus Eisenbacteria bacterium]|nr:DUF4249 family protein [Candidatus Latescibacterota bacterium]MBD3301895.1 DUF4249 family protein [Candidatus Eisenbacteria bacterium]
MRMSIFAITIRPRIRWRPKMSRCFPSCRRSGSMSRSSRFVTSALAILALLPVGCGEDTASPETRDEVAVFGYLYAGEPVSGGNAILVTRTRPVDDLYDPGEAAVRGALVTLRREGYAPDTLREFEPGHYGDPDLRIEPRTTYHLSIVAGDRTLTGTTTTPHPFEMLEEPLVTPDSMRYEEIPDRHPIVLTCPDEEQIFYLDVYCEEEWEDARYIHPFGDHEKPDDYDEYGGANGEPRHIAAYFRIKNVDRVDEGAFRITFYGAMMVFYGAYEIQVLSIDDNFYNYLYREHPEESGGISGGIGVFGSACRERYDVFVTE